MRHWDTDAYRQLQARNTAARKSTRGTTFLEARLRLNQSLGRPLRMDEFFKHTHTHKEDRHQLVDEHSRMAKAAIEAGVINPPHVSEESIWIETVGGKRRGRVYGMGEVRNSSMVRPQVDGPTTTTSTNILDLREQIIILNREVEQHAAKYRELGDRYQREKR
ncbi:hypothetical protein Ahy_A01g003074 isoform A [Arachis hypogaea]|uniref:Uncharacterized protein n=1 Tax=Arachis hypogaea TaxID=3818 RepID=A0A445ES51_ARAHY|nr:hypothetical protein Ahy_A01g003074 isoform A [Arachis hypogaea]